MKPPTGYEEIKALAKATERTIPDLIVLARNNDPFFAGSEAHRRDAQWFADWFQRLGFDDSGGVHLRAVHYRLVSQAEPPVMPSGKPYINTQECWSYLGGASKQARLLGIVNAEAFEDHRNPDPVICATDAGWFQRPSLEPDYWEEWSLPTIGMGRVEFRLPLPTLIPTGYDYDDLQQPYHLEIWIEKSTMNDMLLPLCEQYGVNLVSSIGFQSISSSIALVRRARRSGKPIRVFYISDFDPAGDFMPQAVARQIEYWRYRLGITAEIKLQSLALTRAQVIEYQLPSIPIKESDLRATGFAGRHGMLATELDALEALRPGVLARLVEEAIEPYHDPTLERAWIQARSDANRVAIAAQKWVVQDSRSEIDVIETEMQAILEKYHRRVMALNLALQEELKPFRERLPAVRLARRPSAGH